MKKSTKKIIFLGVCICFIFACSKTEEIGWVNAKNISVAWDATTAFEDGTPISQDIELRYNVYIDRDTDTTHEDKELLTEEPIAGTSYTIDSIKHKGNYFIGIQTLAYKVEDGRKKRAPEISRIAWSSNKTDTQSGAFGIRIK